MVGNSVEEYRSIPIKGQENVGAKGGGGGSFELHIWWEIPSKSTKVYPSKARKM